jgi:hypothetical protein
VGPARLANEPRPPASDATRPDPRPTGGVRPVAHPWSWLTRTRLGPNDAPSAVLIREHEVRSTSRRLRIITYGDRSSVRGGWRRRENSVSGLAPRRLARQSAGGGDPVRFPSTRKSRSPFPPEVKLGNQTTSTSKARLFDLVTQAIQLRGARRGGLQRGGNVRRVRRHGESLLLLVRLYTPVPASSGSARDTREQDAP